MLSALGIQLPATRDEARTPAFPASAALSGLAAANDFEPERTTVPPQPPAARPSAIEARVTHDFDALYTEHFNFVWRSLRRLGVHPSWVEDAAQDTFLVVHRRLSDLRPDASAKAFLFGIALRVARDYRRRAQRKQAASLDVEKEISHASGPYDQAARAQAVEKLESFLLGLDEDRRAVFVLSELEGMTAPEISAALGANQNTVYSRLRSARERFVAFAAERAGHG